MNKTDHNLAFIKNKIADIGVGIFRSESDNLIQLPHNLVSPLDIDDEGHIWFYTSCKNFADQNIAQKFYAYLDFNKKDYSERLTVNGPAELVTKDNSAHCAERNNTKVLVRMKLMSAEYHTSPVNQQVDVLSTIKSMFQNLFTTSDRQMQFH